MSQNRASQKNSKVRGSAAHEMTPTCSEIDNAFGYASIMIDAEIAEWYHLRTKTN